MNEQPLLKEENLLIIKELEAQPFATQRHLFTKRCGLCFILKYLKGTFASLVLSTIFITLLFPKLELASSAVVSLEEGFKLFCLAFGFGFGFNSILIEFSKWFGKE